MFFNDILTPWLGALPLGARLYAFFCLSPLFARIPLSLAIRGGLALAITFVLTPLLPSLPSPTLSLVLSEIGVGFCIGCLCAFFFEAAGLAGQVIGTLSGFSATELVDPLTHISEPLFQKFCTLTLFTLFFACDGHHLVIRFLYETLHTLPIAQKEDVWHILLAVHHLFLFALDLLLIPLTWLGGVIVALAFLSRSFPFLPIFYLGLPLQLFVGTYALILTFSWFPHVLNSMLTWLLCFLHQKT